MRTLILSCLLLSAATVGAQPKAFSGRVVDSETREPLPMATIQGGQATGTLANRDGYFTVDASPSDVLRFSYIGYQPLLLKAADMKTTVALRPLSVSLGEVVVKPRKVNAFRLLARISRQFIDEQQSHFWYKSTYFYRQITRNDQVNNELMEAFFLAGSSGNVHDLQLLTGRYGKLEDFNTFHPFFTFPNFFLSSQIGPHVYNANYWKDLITPLSDKPTKQFYRDNYYVDFDCQVNDDGSEVYVFTFNSRAGYENQNQMESVPSYVNPLALMGIVPPDKSLSFAKPIVVGKLYVDVTTLQVQGFEGQVANVLVRVRDRSGKPSLQHRIFNFRMAYKHDRGYPEVLSLMATMQARREGRNVTYWSTLFNVGNQDARPSIVMSDQANLRLRIDSVGYDSLFWQRNEVVRRTAAEDSVIRVFEREGLFGIFKQDDWRKE